MAALVLPACGDNSSPSDPNKRVFGDAIECGDPKLGDVVKVEGEHIVRVVLPAGTTKGEVLRIAAKFDATVPSQSRELADAGIFSQRPPDCERPALYLGVKDGTDSKKLEQFVKGRAPGAHIE